jgi:hypothetical protein
LHGVVEDHPGDGKAHPRVLGAVAGRSEVVEVHSGALENYLEVKEDYPGVIEDPSGVVKAFPGVLEDHPEVAEVHPLVIDAYGILESWTLTLALLKNIL